MKWVNKQTVTVLIGVIVAIIIFITSTSTIGMNNRMEKFDPEPKELLFNSSMKQMNLLFLLNKVLDQTWSKIL